MYKATIVRGKGAVKETRNEEGLRVICIGKEKGKLEIRVSFFHPFFWLRIEKFLRVRE